MDEIMFETIDKAVGYAEKKEKEIIVLNPLAGYSCPNCKEYDRITLYADEPQYHETFSTSWWDWLEIAECSNCGTIYQFCNGT